ncbi:MAG: hypothetical protein R3F21_15680 [Myxococcota bacterium]
MTSPQPDRESEGEGGPRTETGGPEAGGAYAPKRSVAAADEAKLSLVALRDGAIIAVLLSIFAAAESWATVSRLGFATFLSVVDGLLVGAATNALVHEWGHFVGARLGGGHAPLKPLTKFLPLYDFDYANNDGRAFLWMSYGGNLAHAALVLAYLALVHTPGREGTAALVAGAFGFAVFSSLVEIPVIQQARRGVPGLEALGVIPKDFVNRYLPWALGAAFLAYAVL